MRSMRIDGIHRRGGSLLFLVVVIGWVDWLSGTDIGLSLLYLYAITAAALGTNRSWTWGIVAACAVSWMAAQTLGRPGQIPGAVLWNGLSRAIIYSAAGWAMLALRADRVRLAELNAELQRSLEAQRVLARTDALTGLANGRSFREQLEARLLETARGLCLAYIDVDNFKRLNDVYGHAAGDEVLRRIAEIIRSGIPVEGATRSPDQAARIGGDEFVILFEGADAQEGQRIAAGIISRVSELAEEYPDALLGISIGLSCVREGETDGEVLVRRADDAMYAAKALGKGRYVVAGGMEGGKGRFEV
jgi:diguanylate cyclase (GGDEF)-like protein